VRVEIVHFRSVHVEAFQHAPPPVICRLERLIQHQVEVNLDETCRVFGALEIATHPVEAVGYA
jgi:hypothetical protein